MQKFVIQNVILTGCVAFRIFMCDQASAKTASEIKQIATAVTVKIELNGINKQGSGVISKKEGDLYTIVTNAHVICANNWSTTCPLNSTYTITTADNRKYQVSATGVSKAKGGLDLGTIKMRSSAIYPTAQFADSTQVKNQETIYAAGFPFQSVSLKFGSGRVVANVKNRLKGDQGGYSMLYDAATLPGMSGSAIFNDRGQVVAIHGQGDKFAKNTDISDEYEYRLGEKIGINRGIPSNRLAVIINSFPTSVENKVVKPSTADELLVDSYNKVVNPDSDKNIKSDKREAVKLVDRAIKLQPRYIYAYLLRGWILIQLKSNKAAIADFDRAIYIDPKYDLSYLLRASAKTASEDNQNALNDYNTVLSLNPENYLALEGRGFLRIALKDNKGAMEDFNRAIKITERNGLESLISYLGKCRINAEVGNQKNVQDCDKAINIYEEERKHWGVKNRVLYSAYANRGAYRFKAGDRKGALLDMDTAINLNKTDQATYINRGSLKYAIGKKQDALGDFHEALKLGSKNINMYLGIGMIEEEEGNIDEALSAYERALSIYKSRSDIVNSGLLNYTIENLRNRRNSGVRTRKPTTVKRPQLDKEVKIDFNLAYSIDGIGVSAISPSTQTLGTIVENNNENDRRLSGSSSSVAFSPSGQLLAAGDTDGNINIWQFQDNGQFSKVFTRNIDRAIKAIAIIPDEKILLMANGTDIIFWRLSDGKIVRYLYGGQKAIISMAISPDGQTLATGSMNKTIRIWRLLDGTLLKTLTGHQMEVSSIAFSPDGKTIVSGSRDKTVKIWRLQDGQILQNISLTGDFNRVKSVAVSPDGKTIVSTGDTISIWEFDSGKLISTLKDEYTSSVVISPNGQTFITGNNTHDLKIWQLRTGKLLRTIKGHQSSVYSVAISPDGRTLVSGGRDRSIKIWQADPRKNARN
jgi:WD40 repeat protein/S1-C subfamily serine protease